MYFFLHFTTTDPWLHSKTQIYITTSKYQFQVENWNIYSTKIMPYSLNVVD